MAIYDYLDASTDHVTADDLDLLRGAPSSLVVFPYGDDGFEGCFVSLTFDEDELDEHLDDARAEGFSDAFITLMRHAKSADCMLVRLDPNGDLLDGFPVFNTEEETA